MLVANNQLDDPEGVAQNRNRGSMQPARGSGHEEVFAGSEQEEAVRRPEFRFPLGIRGWAN